MTRISLDPVGMGLLRELVEAYEAMCITTEIFFDDPRLYKDISAFNEKPLIDERWARDDAYDTLCQEFCAHLLLMGSPDVDIQKSRDLWMSEMAKPETDRQHSKLWDAVWSISRGYINLYNSTNNIA